MYNHSEDNRFDRIPDDLDRLFERLNEQEPAPGPAFQQTLESLRGWHEQPKLTVLPPKTGTARHKFPFLIATVAASFALFLIIASLLMFQNGTSDLPAGQSSLQVGVASEEEISGTQATTAVVTVTDVPVVETTSAAETKPATKVTPSPARIVKSSTEILFDWSYYRSRLLSVNRPEDDVSSNQVRMNNSMF
ncbi:MAG TPA: hypothetical protein VH186_05435 [Chloroflexia bacterium]|nr:hypothetical protein [Chloroflexia bacterium]